MHARRRDLSQISTVHLADVPKIATTRIVHACKYVRAWCAFVMDHLPRRDWRDAALCVNLCHLNYPTCRNTTDAVPREVPLADPILADR